MRVSTISTLFFKLLFLIDLASISAVSYGMEKHHGNSTVSITSEPVRGGHPLLLIPGFNSDQSIWKPVLQQLSQHDIHRVSVAGFASTPPVEAISMARIVDDIANYLLERELTVTAVGHSMGAAIAYQLALKYPSLVDKIIAVDGLPFVAALFAGDPQLTAEEVAPSAKNMATQFKQASPASLEQMAKMSISLQAKAVSHKQKILAMAKKSHGDTSGTLIYELMTTDLRTDIASLRVPILLLGASGGFTADHQHQYIERFYRQQMAQAQDVRVKMNRKSLHFIMYDQPSWLADEINQFLLVKE